MNHRHCLWTISLVHLLAGPAAALGPGLGNLEYDPSELFQPISIIQSPSGHGSVAMVKGYLMVIYSLDSGGTPSDGGIEFWDISNPRGPVLAVRHDNTDTHGLREAHGFGLSNSYPGFYMVAQAHEGIQFWDLTDPLDISLISYMDLPGISPGDYTGNWWVFWQAPYVYVGGTNSGLYVVDATDPANPSLRNRVLTSGLGGMVPAQAFAVGNLLVLMDNAGADYATMDISDPTDPILLRLFTGASGYSHTFAAGRILTSGGDGGPSVMAVHDVGHDGAISFFGSAGSGLGNGGYGSYQDGFFFSGFSIKIAKFDVANLAQVGTGTSGIQGRDEDFALVLGNLVWAGSDHVGGSALIVHQAAPDLVGPDVHWVDPPDGGSWVALTSRVGISMSDNVDIDSVDSSTFSVRPLGGAPCPGKYSVQMGIVNFCPDDTLQPGTVYEVSVNGVRDWAGNSGASFTSRFTTINDQPGAPHCALEPFTPAEVDSTARFQAGHVSDPLPQTYSWDFGDGSPPTPPSRSPVATHVYNASGRYSVVLTVENSRGRASCSGVQIVHYPLTPSQPVASSQIVHDGTRVYNVNPDQGTVTAIDTAALAKDWEAPVGAHPRSLAVAPDGSIWVTCADPAQITVLDPGDGSSRSTIALPHGSLPGGIVAAPDGSALYVTLKASGQLLKLDPDGTIVDSLFLGPEPVGIAIAGDSNRIFATRFISPSDHGEVWEVDAGAWSLVRTFELAFDPGPDTEASGRGVPNYLTSLRISPDGRTALVPSKKDNVARGLFRDGQPLTFESRTRTIVSFLDLNTNVESLASRIDLNDRSMAQSVAFSLLGDIFFVGVQGSNVIEIFDASNGESIGSVATGLAPQGLLIDPSGKRLFVHNFMSRSVSVLDVSDLVTAVNNSATLLAEIPTAANEALSPEVLLGKRIFYNAADPQMSRDGYISCASCHLDGGADGQVWDFTQSGEGLRNTIPMTGRAGTGHGNLHWTANFDEIQDFEGDIRDAFGGTGFMSDADYANTVDPLGAPKSGLSPTLDALAAYAASLDRFPGSPLRDADGTLTADAEEGLAIFDAKGCASCHSGGAFTDGLRHDVGTIQESSGQGMGEPLEGIGFDTPTLRGLWASAPYLHNGQAATLEEVLMSAEHGGTDTFTPAERAQLVAYLLQVDAPPHSPTDVAQADGTALSLSVHPNPPRPGTMISFTTPATDRLCLSVHDVTGRMVCRLADGPMAAGRHQIAWPSVPNGKSAGFPSGVYFLRLKSQGRMTSARVVVVR